MGTERGADMKTDDEMLINFIEAKVQAIVDKLKSMSPQERAENAAVLIRFQRLLAGAIAKLEAADKPQ